MSITGRVYEDILGRPGLQGWVVEVTGPVNSSASADATGAYTISGLPPGTYLVCEVIQSSWAQTFPRSANVCPSGVGYRFTLLIDGQIASFVNFGNVRQ